MPFKIVRNDITKMNTEAIVNTASELVAVGSGCDYAVYKAAGYEELFAYRKDKIGEVPEGEVFLTPGFGLTAEYIIHAVSPLYMDGNQAEEEKLRNCYRKSLQLAKEKHITSIAFPLISTGSFGYPKEEGMRIAVDEINAFLLGNDMEIYLVVFDNKATSLGEKLYPDLEAYIDQNYVRDKREEEYTYFDSESAMLPNEEDDEDDDYDAGSRRIESLSEGRLVPPRASKRLLNYSICKKSEPVESSFPVCNEVKYDGAISFGEGHESGLRERMRHLSDTFSQYLLYLIQSKGMENSEVWRRAIVDKKVFSKIKNNPNYHPNKITALCLCVGAKLNLDETKDLLARAGYALSPCDKTDIIFSYFIENKIYDMIEIDIQLEEHDLPCIIS